MARAIVTGIKRNFAGAPDVRDDTTNGWVAAFEMTLVGSGVPNGFDQTSFEAHFLDTDLAVAMDNKVRDAARARATALSIPGASTLPVISFLPPRRL